MLHLDSSINDIMDMEKAEWKTGTVVIINSKNRLEDPDNFFNYIINFFTNISTNLYQYTNEPIVVEFNNSNSNSNNSYKKIVSLQDFKSEQYFNEYFQVDFLDYSIHNVYNYFPNSIKVKKLSDNYNTNTNTNTTTNNTNNTNNDNTNKCIEYIDLVCINIYEKFFLGINRIDRDNIGKENVFECYFKLFNKEYNNLVFLIDRMSYGDKTITYKFGYNYTLLDEVTILTILKKIMIKN
jgi:hypothetical protein